MAKQLAQALGIAFLRFDMSEYMERHSVSRLVGAPPGYVGYEQGGLLTEAVSQSPHAVLLLDEIEKAHPEVFNILLQVMDHGTLTDTNGKKADFRHVILLMSSNVGAREIAQRRVGFETGFDGGADQQAYERTFSPEFRNRLDSRIAFKALTPDVMERIVEKFIAELETQLRERKVTITLTPEARKLLAERGHHPTFGARPLARVIDEAIKRPLTEELLFGKLENGGKVTIAVKKGEIVLKTVV
jgi:ATP-dependent Clp protease ATP-binding subunit ClpA